MSHQTCGLILLALCLSTPGPAHAVQSAARAGATCDTGLESDRTANRLYGEGLALMTDRAQWSRAARLLEKSATLRSECDPRARTTWRLAARIHHQAGDWVSALTAFLEAASTAERGGAAADAVHALLDAALIAVDLGRDWSAVVRIRSVDRLLASAPLTEQERQTVRRRLVDLRGRTVSRISLPHRTPLRVH